MKYSLIVFDLDFTLWNAGGTWCDHTLPPYRKVMQHVRDSQDSIIFLYPETRNLLIELAEKYRLGIASRTHQPSWALELMQLFEIRHLFEFIEIYPGSKQEHFHHIHEKSGIPFQKMLFFDDEMRNVEDVQRLEAESVLVNQGITRELVYLHL